MPRSNLKTYSGNRITVEFDGQIVGLVQSVRMSDSYALEDASGIGDIHVIEHVPTKATHQLSVSNMTLFTGNLRQLGISQVNGESALQGLVFDIVVYGDNAGGRDIQLGPGGVPNPQPPQANVRLRTYIACSFDSGDVDITAHRIVMQSAQFKCLDVIDAGI